MCNGSFWIYEGTSKLNVSILIHSGLRFSSPGFNNFSRWQKQGPTSFTSLSFSFFLCKCCCTIPKWSSDARLLHSLLSKRYFAFFQKLLHSIYLPVESPPPSPDPVNRSPSLHLGRQLSPARFLVDSCDAAAHVRQEFCPGWRHLCCDGLCESLSEDLQDDTAEDLHETQNNPVAWMAPGQPPPLFFSECLALLQHGFELASHSAVNRTPDGRDHTAISFQRTKDSIVDISTATCWCCPTTVLRYIQILTKILGRVTLSATGKQI